MSVKPSAGTSAPMSLPVKRFGIYLAYAPTVDLRHQGLGRYLAAFLGGAAERDDVRFTILCPSWSQRDLRAFFSAENISPASYDLRSPGGQPLILRAYEAWRAWRARPKKPPLREGLLHALRAARSGFLRGLEERLVHAHSLASALPLLLYVATALAVALGLTVLLALPLLLGALLLGLSALAGNALTRAARPLRALIARASAVLVNPKEDGFVLRLYQRMAQVEEERMQRLAMQLGEVQAWYCPTAFWPAFHRLPGPKLMCVPDLVLGEFPVDYAGVGGDRFLATFDAVETAIREGSHFVVYSETVKWETLVGRYAVPAANVAVVRHAPNDLRRWVHIGEFEKTEETARGYAGMLFESALRRSPNQAYTGFFRNSSARFLFYASQFRPNKNLISLLRAYEHLLRKRLLGHKLILTGDADAFPPVRDFIAAHGLQNEVLCLPRLPVQELAACYRLADLAVNPSLSEGGCPFTFCEALSVGTPAVMSRIAVTEEVLTDEAVREASLFDPYDWQDMAQRIEWALAHRAELLAIQRPVYETLSRRNWSDVVLEHVDILERIARNDEANT